MSNMLVKETSTSMSELDVQITTAKAYPRNVQTALAEAVSMATMSQEIAESCIYALPRKNDKGQKIFIKGPSIRLAEIMMCAWGNMHGASRMTINDGKTVTAEGAAWDLEKNVRVIKESKRSIVGKTGQTYSADMQVMASNAAAAIALRNAILSTLPRTFALQVYDAAVKAAVGEQKTLASRVTSLIKRFEVLGIVPDKIFSYYGRRDASEFTADDVEDMIGVGTSLKEKVITIEQAFTEESATDNNPAAVNLENRMEQNTAKGVTHA
jgi:hypothetical protein